MKARFDLSSSSGSSMPRKFFMCNRTENREGFAPVRVEYGNISRVNCVFLRCSGVVHYVLPFVEHGFSTQNIETERGCQRSLRNSAFPRMTGYRG